MKKYFSIFYLLFSILLLPRWVNAKKDSTTKPNIILILVDDLGLSDISLNGNPYPTPHIDALAQSGVTCTRGYVTSSVCAPSRASLLTGRYQNRFGFENQMHQRVARNRFELFWARNIINPYPWEIQNRKKLPRNKNIPKQGLPATEITLAKILKQAGYSTGIIGKWHLGSSDFSLPNNVGFDYHYGFYQSHSLYAPEGTPGIVDMHNPNDWSDKHIWSGQRKGDCAIYQNGEEITEPEYLTKRIAEESIQFMEQQKNHPFFLYIPFNAPHTPFQVPKDYYDKFYMIEDPVKRTYTAMISVLDDAVGNIMSHLSQSGLEENTLVFFLSDNGGAAYTHATDNAPLKGGKLTGFDGGFRVPFFVKWKGHLKEGKTYSHKVSSMDIFATSCAVASVPLPTDRRYDGVNLLPYFLGEKGENKKPHNELYWKAGVSRSILKDEWKLLFDDKWNQTLLYQLEKDPGETINCASDFPEKVEELKKIYTQWEKKMPPASWSTIVNFIYEDESGKYYFEL